MMNKIIKPAYLQGKLFVPSSKSYLQRAIAMAMLSRETSHIHHSGHCNDSLAALSIAKQFGAIIQESNYEITIQGRLSPVSDTFNCHESGLCFRMFAPIIALSDKELVLTGSGSLTQRPQHFIVDALQQFDVKLKSNNGFLPLKIKGPLRGTDAIIDASLSSQLLSGLLMALPLSNSDSTVHVQNLKSIPYVRMTINLLNKFGIEIHNKGNSLFKIKANQSYTAIDYNVEGDWSAASFIIAAALINGNITIKGLQTDSLQADKAILDLLKIISPQSKILPNTIHIKSCNLNAFEFDATNCPDLFPPLVAIAAHSSGKSIIKGVSRLKHKESDRAASLIQEFKKFGIHISINNDYMLIEGGKIKPASVNSHNDHRIAMALAVASLKAESNITITDAQCVNKSYPRFFSDLEKLSR